jgi:uncharacterized membrane protein
MLVRRICATVILVWSSSTFALPQYKVMDLGEITPGSGSGGVALNESNQAVGYAFGLLNNTYVGKPALFSGGTISDLSLFSSSGSLPGYAQGINKQGQAVGYLGLTSVKAFVYDGAATTILTVPGSSTATANGINDAGLVSGSYSTASGKSAPFFYDGSYHFPPILIKGTNGVANRLNNSGQAAGYADNVNATDAVVYTANGVTDLGVPAGAYAAFGQDINEHGHVAGTAYVPGGSAAFIHRNGSFVQLASPPGYVFANVLGMNNHDWVVGEVGKDGQPLIGAVWANGEVATLQSLLVPESRNWSITDASDINDSGIIVGRAFGSLSTHAVLLFPVPEPKAGHILSIGLAAMLGVVAWRRSRCSIGL